MVSTARSGTNHISRLIGNLRGIHVYLEVFHPKAPTYHDKATVRAFSHAVGIPFTDYRDPRLGKWIHENIQGALDTLQSAAAPGSRFASIKVFEDHLPFLDFERYFVETNDVRFLIVKRRPIDAFISFQKASHLKRWVGVDTTTVRLPINADAFALWHESRSRWFAFVDDLVTRYHKRSSTLFYDDEILTDDEKTLHRIIAHLRRLGVDTTLRRGVRLKRSVKRVILPAAEHLGINTHWDLRLGAARQDRSTLASEKVTNWSSFLAALEDRYDLRMLDAYFMRGNGFPTPSCRPALPANLCKQIVEFGSERVSKGKY